MALRLQAAFGLRREEAIKFSPAYADRGDRIVLKASTTKGGRAREIPIWNDGQRAVLDAARRLSGGGAARDRTGAGPRSDPCGQSILRGVFPCPRGLNRLRATVTVVETAYGWTVGSRRGRFSTMATSED